jgi:hypothetical protein
VSLPRILSAHSQILIKRAKALLILTLVAFGTAVQLVTSPGLYIWIFFYAVTVIFPASVLYNSGVLRRGSSLPSNRNLPLVCDECLSSVVLPTLQAFEKDAGNA